MSNKTQLEKFIIELESNIHIKFKWIDKNKPKGKFTIENNSLNKKISGTLELENKNIKAKIFYNKNYSEKYIRSQLRNILEAGDSPRDMLSFINYFPRLDDFIATKFLLGETVVGENVKIPSGTYYYSVNDDYFDCNGWQLENRFVGEFVDQVNRKCEDGSSRLPHNIFKLIAKY